MQNRFGLLDTGVMPIFMIIALDIFITMRFSINCSAVICSPTVIHAILREATSETYGPRVERVGPVAGFSGIVMQESRDTINWSTKGIPHVSFGNPIVGVKTGGSRVGGPELCV